ncbi:MORC family CW-type zinc finger protein 3-like isoform X2 [Rhopilema esculentum]|uniref:MORC family CW-type zinc finger protein 3-like isoform X2 n=1 Tax=Rhopilema esculentum TaxID=499914 RepID=UPI0031E3556D
MTELCRKGNARENEAFEIPVRASDGQYLSALHPKYLHTNSTSHTWPFSAVAELIDNAYDPDVNASQLIIDVKMLKGQTLLVFTDNGTGMSPSHLYKMVSFGFSEKIASGDHLPVGQYGNGFKSGSMRLGKDALVFTKRDNRCSLAFLSQTYLEKINSKTIIVPLATWDTKKFTLLEADNGGRKSLRQILEHSVISTIADLKEEFKQIPGSSGTRIIIYNLRRYSGGIKYELDFTTDSNDIRIPDDLSDTDEARYKREQRQDHIPASDYSLRAYCSILYLKPRMQIILRGKKVKTTVIAKSLAKTEVDLYKPSTPSGYAKPVKITFGFSQNKNHYGIMMYHRNRLIKPYVRVGYQLKPNSLGVGVIGVIECDFLQPTHNKQDFDQSKAFRACMAGLGRKLNEYWQEKKGSNKQATSSQQLVEENEVLLPDQKWVQCDNMNCLKWRILPDNTNLDSLPDKWYCKDHPLEEWRSCDIPEKLEDKEETITPYKKEVTKQMKKEQQQKRKQTENSSKLATELQQMVEKKEQELEEEKRKRSQNEIKAKAHEQEIKRLKLELEKSRAKDASSGDATPSDIMSMDRTMTPSERTSKKSKAPVASAVTITARPTRQSINQAIKVRLPFTTRRNSLAATTGEIAIAPVQTAVQVSESAALTATPRGSQGASTNLAVNMVTSVISTKQSPSVLACIQPQPGVLSKQVITFTPTRHSGATTSQQIQRTPATPKLYRFVVTDPSKVRLPENLPFSPSSIVQAKIPKTEPMTTAVATNSMPVNTIGQQIPTSKDISKQLAQIGIDAIAAQAEMMVPSMAISTESAATSMAPSASEDSIVSKSRSCLEDTANGLNTRPSTLDNKESNADVTGSKRVHDEDDEVQIIDSKAKKKCTVKNEDSVQTTKPGTGEIEQTIQRGQKSNGIDSDAKKGEKGLSIEGISQDVFKNVDKDLIEDIKRIPEGKARTFLMQRSQQLRDLRKSICQLLGLLVPDLNLPQPGKMPLDDNTIDVLLRDVLDANKDSKTI